MSGISTTWYARLEQGREIAPSSAVLGRIANALQLGIAERTYLFQLAERVFPRDVSNSDVSSFNNRLPLDAMGIVIRSISTPAYLLDKYWTPILWNPEAARIFSLWLEGPELNLLRHMFLEPEARTFVVDWELSAQRLLAQFRFDFGNHSDDPEMIELVQSISDRSEVFRNIWNDHQVMFRGGSEKSYNHPRLGLLRYFQTTFLAAEDLSLKLVIVTPRS